MTSQSPARRIAAAFSCGTGVLLLSAGAALAHTSEIHEAGASWWAAWDLSPDIALPTALVAGVYLAGFRRRRHGAGGGQFAGWRAGAFLSGLAVVFLALQSPLDPLAEHLFSVHQVQHLLLRMLGPMLIMLAWPAGCLVAGLPPGVRRRVLAPSLASGALRGVFGLLAQPIVTTALFIAALYLWQIPGAHNAALLDEPLHYLMHVSMLVAGLVFWWRIFDRRPPPQGTGYGLRVLMLGLVILSNIVLGAYTTLKGDLLYTAYDVTGRVFGVAARGDEQLGGIIIWIPGSMMCLIAVLVVIHLWGRQEGRAEEKRLKGASSSPAALAVPTTAAEMIARQRPKNRALALGFAAFVFCVFAAAVLAGVLDNPSGFDKPAGAAAKPELHAAPAATPPKLR